MLIWKCLIGTLCDWSIYAFSSSVETTKNLEAHELYFISNYLRRKP